MDRKTRFTHRDRLGSATSYTDHNGAVTAYRGYDPFGKPLGGDWSTLVPAKLENNPADTDMATYRGFTDHEHLDEVELIHMNGRVYDYNLGRFLSVDPFIQAPGNSQSLNPYSYIMNNPLAGTDPTGYCAVSRIKTVCENTSAHYGGNQEATEAQNNALDGKFFGPKNNGARNNQGSSNTPTMDIGSPASSTSEETNPQKSLVIGLMGYHDGGSSGTLKRRAENQEDENTDVQVISVTHKGKRKAEKAIRDFRKDNEDGRVVIHGYSRGGGAAIEIANNLGDDEIQVDSLVLFDPWRGMNKPHVLQHDNVKSVLSFHQINDTTRWSGIFGGRGGNPFTGNPVIFKSGRTQGLNVFDLTGKKDAYGNLYEHNSFVNQVYATPEYRRLIGNE